ncbi:DUF2513 domain-containing protein [Streptococcus oralis]|uniref:DUF2513 domain-containing protein n=1 Tax=Streptococcus oralis TaxID=1303 RepID=UPI002001ABB0
MKLNPDCIRDLLLDVEAKSTFDNVVIYSEEKDEPLFNKYGVDTVFYHIRQADHAGFFIGEVTYTFESAIIIDLSPAAHEFLANIRQDTNWNKTKSIASKAGSFSLNVLKDISVEVISKVISDQLNK